MCLVPTKANGGSDSLEQELQFLAVMCVFAKTNALDHWTISLARERLSWRKNWTSLLVLPNTIINLWLKVTNGTVSFTSGVWGQDVGRGTFLWKVYKSITLPWCFKASGSGYLAFPGFQLHHSNGSLGQNHQGHLSVLWSHSLLLWCMVTSRLS